MFISANKRYGHHEIDISFLLLIISHHKENFKKNYFLILNFDFPNCKVYLSYCKLYLS